MSLFQGLGQRGGNRGGKDQFNWDDVRGDKFKDYYLGQSVRIQSNWWLDGKLDVTDPKKRSQKTNNKEQDLAQIKANEQQLMMEALGLAPKSVMRGNKPLEKHEMKELLAKGADKDEFDVDRVGGIGYAPRVRKLEVPKKVEQGEGAKEETEGGLQQQQQHVESHLRFKEAKYKVNRDETEERKKKSKVEKKEKKEKKEKRDKKDKKHKKKRNLEDSREHGGRRDKKWDRERIRERDYERKHKRRRHDSD